MTYTFKRDSSFSSGARALIILCLLQWTFYAPSTCGTPLSHGPGLGLFNPPDPVVPLINEGVAWRGPHRSILSRTVSVPGSSAAAAGKTITFDVLDPNHGNQSVLVFIWNSNTQSATLIREFHPGPMEWQFGVVAGGYEAHKHTSPLHAARCELEEEAGLVGGTWMPLLEDTSDNEGGEEEEAEGVAASTEAGHLSLGHDKYSTERFYPFLVIDPKRASNDSPGALKCDHEESIRVFDGLSVNEMRALVRSGRLNCPSSAAVLLALDRLQLLALL